MDEQLTAMRTRVDDGEKALADAHERERKLSDEIQQIAQQKSTTDEQNSSVLLVQLLEAQQSNTTLLASDKEHALRVQELGECEG